MDNEGYYQKFCYLTPDDQKGIIKRYCKYLITREVNDKKLEFLAKLCAHFTEEEINKLDLLKGEKPEKAHYFANLNKMADICRQEHRGINEEI